MQIIIPLTHKKKHEHMYKFIFKHMQVMAKRSSLSFPIKWFSVPQCWRYERMSLGRKREHFQWNMDIWGVKGCEAELELLSAIVNFFKRVGFTPQDIAIKVAYLFSVHFLLFLNSFFLIQLVLLFFLHCVYIYICSR